MSKTAKIAIVVVLVLVASYFVYNRTKPTCIAPRNRKKFPDGWQEDNVPGGDLYAIADKYAKGINEGNSQMNGSIVGGFFKAIDVYPSMNAADYYSAELKNYLKAGALPYYNMEVGEALCK